MHTGLQDGRWRAKSFFYGLEEDVGSHWPEDLALPTLAALQGLHPTEDTDFPGGDGSVAHGDTCNVWRSAQLQPESSQVTVIVLLRFLTLFLLRSIEAKWPEVPMVSGGQAGLSPLSCI